MQRNSEPYTKSNIQQIGYLEKRQGKADSLLVYEVTTNVYRQMKSRFSFWYGLR
jgi:hypothetical protein